MKPAQGFDDSCKVFGIDKKSHKFYNKNVIKFVTFNFRIILSIIQLGNYGIIRDIKL